MPARLTLARARFGACRGGVVLSALSCRGGSYFWRFLGGLLRRRSRGESGEVVS